MTATNMCSNFGSKWCSPPEIKPALSLLLTLSLFFLLSTLEAYNIHVQQEGLRD